MGYKSGQKINEDISSGIDRLGSCYIKTNNWYDPNLKKRVPVSSFNFFQKCSYDPETDKCYIKFSDWVKDSIIAHYLKKINFIEATRNLRGYSKILYLKLIKGIGKKTYYEIKVETVLRWLGKWEKYNKMEKKYFNKNVGRFITPAVKKASKAIGFVADLHKGLYYIKKGTV